MPKEDYKIVKVVEDPNGLSATIHMKKPDGKKAALHVMTEKGLEKFLKSMEITSLSERIGR